MIKATEFFDLTCDVRRYIDLVCFLDKHQIEYKTDQFWCPSEQQYMASVSFDAQKYDNAKAMDSLDFI